MTDKTRRQGRIIGVGLGPGAIDLLSVRADRLLRDATHIAYFRKQGAAGRARTLVAPIIDETAPEEYAMEYPVTTEIPLSDPRYNQLLSEFYDSCTGHIASLSNAGHDVIILCEGDPFFYGSFMHLFTRLQADYPVEVVPGITGMSAAWTATGLPMTWGDDVMTVLMGTMDITKMRDALAIADAVVIMKIGRHFKKIAGLLEETGLASRAYIVCYAAMADETIYRLSDYSADRLPYFSIIVIHGQGRRP